MIEFEVKSKTQPIGKRKGQTVYFAQPVSQHHLTNKMVVDRIVRETSLSAGDVSNTLGFGMTFLHELHHTTIGGDYHDSTELFGTGPVVDNMNIIRNELNKQGFNYGERLNYKAIHTKEGNIIPFNESALTSLKYNSSMEKKAHYIKTK